MDLTSNSKSLALGPDYCIKPGYAHRTETAYFEDTSTGITGIVHQPDIYPLAAFLAKRFDCTQILDLGCGRAQKLASLHPAFKVIGVDCGSNLRYCRDTYGFGSWIEHDLESVLPDMLPAEDLKRTLVVCSDVIEHLARPEALLTTLANLLEVAPVALLSTPERDLVRGADDHGPPANVAHVREWNRSELSMLLRKAGLTIGFIGLTNNNDRDLEKKTSVAILHNNHFPRPHRAPDKFRVTALMTAYNEADIVLPSIQHLLDQGIHVHLIDNWSTDNTYELLRPLISSGQISYEHFPIGSPGKTYEWTKLLSRVEELSTTLQCDWFIHHDVDEIRQSPWPECTLRDALYLADRAGFNAIDHTVIDYRPIDNSYVPGTDFGAHFSWWEFGKRPGHFAQIKAWKNIGQRIDLASSGGHDASFHNRKVFPYKFLLRHYPIRSDAHGALKVFQDRLGRFSANERDKGWHTQYDKCKPGQSFLRDPSSLNQADIAKEKDKFLIELLSGIGIIPTPPAQTSHPTVREKKSSKMWKWLRWSTK